MPTRIRLQGFKSFEDTEIRFGPFTCIAGANGVGKSNLFDAIQFLRDLTEFPIVYSIDLLMTLPDTILANMNDTVTDT